MLRNAGIQNHFFGGISSSFERLPIYSAKAFNKEFVQRILSVTVSELKRINTDTIK